MTDSVKAMRIGPVSDRGASVDIIVDGDPIQAYSGETVAAALMAAGRWTHQIHNGRPLAAFCNIGVCYSCLMTINGVSGVRACQTHVADGLIIETRRLAKDRLK
ncbi:MAG: (2Fe-2S)-binding protein [Desulfobacterales bacterium]